MENPPRPSSSRTSYRSSMTSPTLKSRTDDLDGQVGVLGRGECTVDVGRRPRRVAIGLGFEPSAMLLRFLAVDDVPRPVTDAIAQVDVAELGSTDEGLLLLDPPAQLERRARRPTRAPRRGPSISGSGHSSLSSPFTVLFDCLRSRPLSC